MNNIWCRFFAFIAGLACLALAGSVAAQGYPARPVRIVVPVAPGAGADIIARSIAPGMSQSLGQPIIIENKPGAASLLGYEHVARQVPADGYTGIIAAVSGLAILPLITKDLRFDALKDLPPVIGLAEVRLIFGSPAKAPWKSLEEMVAYARANPGRLNYGSSNASVRFWMDVLVRELGINVVHVPYRESSAYFQALVSGEIQMGLVSPSSALPMGDRFRALAVTGERRSAASPDVRTLAELGHPRIQGVGYSLNVRLGTPAVAIEKLHAAASRALQQQEVRAQLANIHVDIGGGSTEAASKRLSDEAAIFAEIAKVSNIQPE